MYSRRKTTMYVYSCIALLYCTQSLCHSSKQCGLYLASFLRLSTSSALLTFELASNKYRVEARFSAPTPPAIFVASEFKVQALVRKGREPGNEASLYPWCVHYILMGISRLLQLSDIAFNIIIIIIKIIYNHFFLRFS